MTRFEYNHFECPGTDLHDRLNELGSEGWRLHTCEPYFLQGEDGVTHMFTIVMDRAYQVQETSSDPDTIKRPEAIACKN